jgi:hypothetical protein
MKKTVYEIWGSCSGKDINVGLLCCNTMKMEAACSSKTLVSTYKSTECYNL